MSDLEAKTRTASPSAASDPAEVRARSRVFARERLVPQAARLDSGERALTHQLWNEAQEQGIVPSARSDVSAPSVYLGTIEELAYGDGGIALLALLHVAAMRAHPVVKGTAGRWAAAYAPDYQDGFPFKMRGVLGAQGAEGLVLLRPGAPACALRERDRQLSFSPMPCQMGLCAAAGATVTVEAIESAKQNGHAEDAEAEAEEALVLLFAGVGAVARGIARRAWDLASDYAQERVQGGGPIARYGAVEDLLASIAEAGAGDADLDWRSALSSLRAALMAKARFAEAALEATTNAVQVFGGRGYMWETGVEKLMRDAKYCQLYPLPTWQASQEAVRLALGERADSRTI